MPHAYHEGRTTFTVDGQHYGAALVTYDPNGYLVESVDYPKCWAIAATIEQAAADLAAQVAPKLPPAAFRVPTPGLDRRPDLRARFSQIVARALARPIDALPGLGVKGRSEIEMPLGEGDVEEVD